MIRLVSLDVWDTLLNIDSMLSAIAEGIDSIIGRGYDLALATVYSVRRKIKALRSEGRIPHSEVLPFSQQMLAEALNTDVEIVKRGIARAMLNVSSRELAINGAREALKKIKKRGYIVVALGNVMFWPSAYTRLLLEKTGLADYIDKQYYSDEINSYKPLSEAFYKPLKEYGIEPSEAIHVGDSRREDYEGALKAGLYAAIIRPDIEGYYMKEHDRGFVIKSIRYLPEVLESL